jgi:ribosomal protein S18 acetylase RimI-like enzyme
MTYGTTLTIRRATPADAAPLARVAERIFRETFGPDNRAEDIEAYVARAYGEEPQRRELEDPAGIALLVEDGGALIAFAQLRLTPDSPHGEIEITRFYVDHSQHGRGVAQALMAVVAETATALQATKVWLGVWERNARAIAFYVKCGFVDAGSQPFLLGSDLQTDRVMVRTLVMPNG